MSFKGQWWCTRLSGTYGTSRITRFTGVDGTCMFLYIIWFRANILSLNCLPFCIICVCNVRGHLVLRDWMGKMGNQGCGWVACVTQSAYPHTRMVRYSKRYAYNTWPLRLAIVWLSGWSRPSRPSWTPRNPSEYHLLHPHDLIWFAIPVKQHELGMRSIQCLSRTVNYIEIRSEHYVPNNLYLSIWCCFERSIWNLFWTCAESVHLGPFGL